jgi:hypothetical protein
MFTRTTIVAAANTASVTTSVAHGINTAYYDVSVIGWYYSASSPGVRAAYMSSPTASVGTMQFTAVPSSGSVIMHFLGIAKGLTDNQ